jgi:HlyD family secretion protein
VITARNTSESVSSDRPYNIAQQRAAVTSAQALVDLARHNLAGATLRAPFDGTITAINGVTGEYLTASTGTTAQAPGTVAAIPGTATNVAASTITRPGGTQFMVISGNTAMSAVVPFQESDAARMLPGQGVDLAFDALPELQLKGTVTAVAPAGTALSGAMSFYVTIRLDGSDKLLKEGLSVRATVHTQERKDVLSVPNGALHTQDGASVVLVVDADGGQHSITVQTGLVGADRTEVVTGLTDGQQVLVPSAAH